MLGQIPKGNLLRLIQPIFHRLDSECHFCHESNTEETNDIKKNKLIASITVVSAG